MNLKEHLQQGEDNVEPHLKQGEASAKDYEEQGEGSAKDHLDILPLPHSATIEITSDKVETIVVGLALSSTGKIEATEEVEENKSQEEAKEESEGEKKSQGVEDPTHCQANESEDEGEEINQRDLGRIITKAKGLIETFSEEEGHGQLQAPHPRMHYAKAITTDKSKPQLEVEVKAISTGKRPIPKPQASPTIVSPTFHEGWEIGVPPIGWETLPPPCLRNSLPNTSLDALDAAIKLKSTSKMIERGNTSNLPNFVFSSKPPKSNTSFVPVNLGSRAELRGGISNTHGARLYGERAIDSPTVEVPASTEERKKSRASLKKERQVAIQREEEQQKVKEENMRNEMQAAREREEEARQKVKEENMRKEMQAAKEREEEEQQKVKEENMSKEMQAVREREEEQQKAEEEARKRMEEQQEAEEEEIRKVEGNQEGEEQKTKEEVMRKRKNEANKKKMKKQRKEKAKPQKAFNLPRLLPYYLICVFTVYLLFLFFQIPSIHG